MPLLQLRSPFARAVVPILAGALGILALAGFTWLMAAYISSGSTEPSERLLPTEFTVGPVEQLAASVDDDGPVLFPELGAAAGTRSIVIDHDGDDPADGWRVYSASPADRDETCLVEQVPDSSLFIDCEGRELTVDDLAPPADGVFPRVDDGTTLVIEFGGPSTPATTTP